MKFDDEYWPHRNGLYNLLSLYSKGKYRLKRCKEYQEWKGVLKFLNCILCDFAYLTGFHIHLLLIQVHFPTQQISKSCEFASKEGT
jgi:hypothetical protein